MYILRNILDNIILKYIYNSPEEILNNPIHLLFQLQSSYWDYIDNYYSNKEINSNEVLPYFLEKEYMDYMVNHYIFLYIRLKNFEEEYVKWQEYITKIPVYGSVLIDPSFKYCLLLHTHFDKKIHYGFPKGKINNGENAIDCAIRETYEETSYDISTKINKDCYVEGVVKGKCTRLYLIFNVDMKTEFYPQKDGEIDGYDWYVIKNLPVGKCWNGILSTLHEKIMDEYMYSEYGIKKFTKKKKEINKNKKMTEIVSKYTKYRSIDAKKYYSDVTPGILKSKIITI